MRQVNADDKRQAAELIELDGDDLRREPPLLNAHQGVDGAVPRASQHGQNHIISIAFDRWRINDLKA